MLSYIFENFDEAYFGLVGELFNNQDVVGSKGNYRVRDIHIEVKNPTCTIEMSKLNYTILKWKHLKQKYVWQTEWKEFKANLKTSSAHSMTFYFKTHEGKQACLNNMVVTRNDKGEWDEVSFFYRIADICKRYPIDLILFYTMCKEMDLDIKAIHLYIPLATFSPLRMAELIGSGYYTLKDFKGPTRANLELTKAYKKYYSKGAELSNRHEIGRKQKLKFSGKKLPEVPIDTLNVEEEINI